MIKHTVRFTVDLTINEGKFDEFEGIAQAMIVGTQKEPGALGYDWYLSGDRRRCRILETYADADAVLAGIGGRRIWRLPTLASVRKRSKWERKLRPQSTTCHASAQWTR